MSLSPRPEPRIVTLEPQDADEAIQVSDEWAYGTVTEGIDQAPLIACFEWDRTRGAYLPDRDGVDRLAGTDSVYSLDLPVPGGSVACAGLTFVGVHPGYRRRGLLTALIRDHLDAVHDRGEPVSALWASEATIYGRFGYGIASRHLRATVPRAAALREIAGADQVRIRLETADIEQHADLVGDCYQAARRSRPGMVSRSTPAQRRRMLFDPPPMRAGGEPLRIMIADADGADVNGPDADGPDNIAAGYVLFRRREHWDGQIPDSTVLIKEFVARDPATARALWERILDIDLTARVETDRRPTDDALFQLLIDPRRAVSTLLDGLWVRLVDLPAALAARRYSAELDVVFEVRDELCPWNAGRWRLQGGPEEAGCTRSEQAPAFTIDVRELGAAYLGSTSLDALAAAGLVTVHDPAGFGTASRAFSWPVAAFCGWIF